MNASVEDANRLQKMPITLLLGAGASRSVSYAHEGGHPSPLDKDFFDLLKRLNPRQRDAAAVDFVLSELESLPDHYRRSMERSFYTLQMRAYLQRKLTVGDSDESAEQRIISTFARCVQALLREAHGKKTCRLHAKVLSHLHSADTIVSFNYDLIVERAFSSLVSASTLGFGDWVYGFANPRRHSHFPLLLKLHGSSNWRLRPGESKFVVLTKTWGDFSITSGYVGHRGHGTTFPIFLPFWDKRIERKPWLALWQTALARLKGSGSLIVWGYSLPETDVKAQQLFELAFRGRKFRLCIVDPSSATRERWREMFPNAMYWEYQSIQDFIRQPPDWWKTAHADARLRR